MHILVKEKIERELPGYTVEQVDTEKPLLGAFEIMHDKIVITLLLTELL